MPDTGTIKHKDGGFTLIEVMVALAILAVVAVAASRASSSYLRSVDTLRTRTLANFVAQNAAADLRINDTWLSGKQTQQVTAQGRDWQLSFTPSDTPSPEVKQIVIAVAPVSETGVGVGHSASRSVSDITILLSNPDHHIGLRSAGQ